MHVYMYVIHVHVQVYRVKIGTGCRLQIIIFSIYKLGAIGISSNLIGLLSLTNGHCPSSGRWIMKQWPA